MIYLEDEALFRSSPLFYPSLPHCFVHLFPWLRLHSCTRKQHHRTTCSKKEAQWYELNVAAGEDNATHSAFADFYKTTIQKSFNEVNDIQERLNDISSKLNQIPGLHEVTPGFDRSLRPETISLPTGRKIFGRDKDLKQVMGLLGVPPNKRGGRPKRKRTSSAGNASISTPASNQVSNEPRVQAIPVLPIVGMGGIGKTTLAQHICNHPQVKSYFELIIWICADDFDVKRLTKDAIESSSGKEAKLDHLDSLQRALFGNLSDKRFLIVIDDMWDDALKENGQRWEKFCAPFKNVVHGSMMLVTTRSPEVADGARTMEPFPLHGLTDGVLWDFFKLCAFGSKNSNNNPDLERIGRSILPKLKGSPLAAITLGRLLRMNLDTSLWQNILDSELWELKQEKTDILPALRLSYIYLPFHLKRCFSFCAVYPKDYKFEKDRLAEIWVAEGFVEPQGHTPLEDIGCQYFQDLFNRFFFQKVAGSYVIHDLLHDMAQLVSVHDCFIIKSVGDFENVPQNDDAVEAKLKNKKYLHTLHLEWSSSTTLSLPKHSGTEVFEVLQPASSLEHLFISSYTGVSPPSWFQPQNFPKFATLSFENCSGLEGSALSFSRVSQNINLNEKLESNDAIIGSFSSLRDLTISNCGNIVSLNDFLDPASLPAIRKIKINECTSLISVPTGCLGDMHCLEELEVVNCPNIRSQRLVAASLKILTMVNSGNLADNIKCCSLTYFAFSSNCDTITLSYPALEELHISECRYLTSIGTGGIRAFSSLISLTVYHCAKLSTLDDFLTAEHLPAVEKITISRCLELLSLPSESFSQDCHSLLVEVYTYRHIITKLNSASSLAAASV
uniref:Uncharacterized protein n=1 Tax=Avena sativa TaxID=4498 RepID=A0ACD5ZDZ3_AVESA